MYVGDQKIRPKFIGDHKKSWISDATYRVKEVEILRRISNDENLTNEGDFVDRGRNHGSCKVMY